MLGSRHTYDAIDVGVFGGSLFATMLIIFGEASDWNYKTLSSRNTSSFGVSEQVQVAEGGWPPLKSGVHLLTPGHSVVDT